MLFFLSFLALSFAQTLDQDCLYGTALGLGPVDGVPLIPANACVVSYINGGGYSSNDLTCPDTASDAVLDLNTYANNDCSGTGASTSSLVLSADCSGTTTACSIAIAEAYNNGCEDTTGFTAVQTPFVLGCYEGIPIFDFTGTQYAVNTYCDANGVYTDTWAGSCSDASPSGVVTATLNETMACSGGVGLAVYCPDTTPMWNERLSFGSGGSSPTTGTSPSAPTTGGSTPSAPTTGGSTPSAPTTGGSTPSAPTTGGSVPTPNDASSKFGLSIFALIACLFAYL